MKNKTLFGIGTLGALCVACCSLPVLGLIGLGSLEAIFCENELLKGAGIATAVLGFGVLTYRLFSKAKSGAACSVGCGCKVTQASRNTCLD